MRPSSIIPSLLGAEKGREREAPLSFPRAWRWSGAADLALDVSAPVFLLLSAAAVMASLVREMDSAVAVFPWGVAALCLGYLAAGPYWASLAGAAATLGGLAAVFYAPDLAHQLVLFLDVAALWACFAQFLRADMDRKTAAARREERLDRLRLETARRLQEAEGARREAASTQERIAAYNRLRFFADDLIGAYNREELALRARDGLAGLFPRARALVRLFPSSDGPDPADDLGRLVLRLAGGRLFDARSSRLPSRGAGRFLLTPLRVRETAIGWAALERSAAEKPFDLQDLRLALIASDLIAMALGNAERYAQIESLALSDGLTGLYTRGYLNERLQEEFAKARHHGRPFSVLIADIDRFKVVNDTHGHRLGDEVLRWLARQITAQCRDTDFVARYGGEEFVVLMPNTRATDALAFGRRLKKAVEGTPFRWEELSLRVTVSGGVAALDDDVVDEVDLLRRADKALYEAKETGRNKVCLHG